MLHMEIYVSVVIVIIYIDSFYYIESNSNQYNLLELQDKLDGFVPAHFLGWYLKVRIGPFFA